MKGPTKDYRPFKGSRKGKPYRVTMIAINNAISMIKKRWAIVVIAFSFFFAFLNIFSLALETAFEENMMLDPEAFFSIQPMDEASAHRLVTFGEHISLEYKVKNVGKDPAKPMFQALVPSELWIASIDTENVKELKPGDEILVRMDIDIPISLDEFSIVSEGDIFQYMGTGRMQVPVENGKEPVDRFDDDQSGAASNNLYMGKVSRIVGIAAAPEQVVQSGEGAKQLLSDPRINSFGSLITLDQTDPEVAQAFGIDPDIASGMREMDLWIKEEGESSYYQKMRSENSSRIDIGMVNPQGSTVFVTIDIFFLPLQDSGLSLMVFDEGEKPLYSFEPLTLPGRSRLNLTLDIWSGYPMYERPYNILVIATFQSGGNLTYSKPLGIELRSVESRYEETNEKFFRLLWGGDIRYERYLWMILLAAVCGGGLISEDLRNNSIALYLSRPITWKDYIVGKGFSLVLVLSTITMLPALVMFMVGMVFSTNDLVYILTHLWILGAMMLSYVIALFIVTSICMALSSISKRGIYSGPAIFSTFIFSSIISDILRVIFTKPYLKLFNINLTFKLFFRPLFGLDYDSKGIGFEWWVPGLVLLGLVTVSWAVIVLRFRNREVAR